MKNVYSIATQEWSVRTALAGMVAILFAVGSAGAQCPTPGWLPGEGLPGVQGWTEFFVREGGRVVASIMWDPDGTGPSPERLVIGGDFYFAGGNTTHYVAMWDGLTWQPLGAGLRAGPDLADPGFALLGRDDNCVVFAFAILPNGDLVAGGTFNEIADAPYGLGTSLGGSRAPEEDPDFPDAGVMTHGHVARFDGTTWHPMSNGISGHVVTSLTVRPNGDLIASGNFFKVNGAACNSIARWDGNAWHPIGEGVKFGGQPIGEGTSLATLPDGDVILSGFFDEAGPISALNIARLHFDASGTNATWSAFGTGLPDPAYDMLALPNGDLIIAGNFDSVDGTPVNRLARWDGNVWHDLGAGLPLAFVADVEVEASGDLIVTGRDSTTSYPSVHRFDGTLWSDLGGPQSVVGGTVPPEPTCITALPNGGVALGIDSQGGIVQWDGNAWSYFANGLNGTIRDLVAMPNGDVVASGDFTWAGGALANHLARFDGVTWSPIGQGINASPSLAVTPNGHLVASGGFTEVDGQPISTFASWDGTSWTQLPVPALGTVGNIRVLSNGHIVGANVLGGALGSTVGRFDGTAWSTLGVFQRGTAAGNVFGIAELPNGDLLVGGNFNTIDGLTVIDGHPIHNVARWDGANWRAMGDGLGTNQATQAVASFAVLPNGNIIAGGFFEFLGESATQVFDVALWDGTTWAPMPGPNTGRPGLSRSVSELLTLPNGQVVAGGIFTTGTFSPIGGAANQPAGLAIWNGSTWAPFGGESVGFAFALTLLPNGNVAVGGDLPQIGGAGLANFGIYCFGAPACSADFNHSGTLDSQDFFDFIAAFFAALPSADFNADGAVNSQDFFDFLAAFFAGC